MMRLLKCSDFNQYPVVRLAELQYQQMNDKIKSVQCCPRYISDIVQTTGASSRRQGLRSSTDTFSYTVPLTYTKFGECTFSVAGPSVWNSLPADIRHITDIYKFKHRLKTSDYIDYTISRYRSRIHRAYNIVASDHIVANRYIVAFHIAISYDTQWPGYNGRAVGLRAACMVLLPWRTVVLYALTSALQA